MEHVKILINSDYTDSWLWCANTLWTTRSYDVMTLSFAWILLLSPLTIATWQPSPLSWGVVFPWTDTLQVQSKWRWIGVQKTTIFSERKAAECHSCYSIISAKLVARKGAGDKRKKHGSWWCTINETKTSLISCVVVLNLSLSFSPSTFSHESLNLCWGGQSHALCQQPSHIMLVAGRPWCTNEGMHVQRWPSQDLKGRRTKELPYHKPNACGFYITLLSWRNDLFLYYPVRHW